MNYLKNFAGVDVSTNSWNLTILSSLTLYTWVTSSSTSGMGVALLPDFICTDAAADGRLVTLFGGRYSSLDEIYLLYSGRHLLPGKSRAFIDFLQDHYRVTLGG
ncbi:MAG: hypothetical protein GWP63_17635 [Haliea sp.]|nr:hypothetical protein [Haliea sp.]